ncbi:hypothetical protein M786_10810 [Neisseria gonorrhoeae MU_NG21]|nr:hypothetical protein M786_10810 [Neisseria gonorrhoeae MU_NG21]
MTIFQFSVFDFFCFYRNDGAFSIEKSCRTAPIISACAE